MKSVIKRQMTTDQNVEEGNGEVQEERMEVSVEKMDQTALAAAAD